MDRVYGGHWKKSAAIENFAQLRKVRYTVIFSMVYLQGALYVALGHFKAFARGYRDVWVVVSGLW